MPESNAISKLSSLKKAWGETMRTSSYTEEFSLRIPCAFINAGSEKFARVLLIEDDRSMRRLVRNSIEKHCYLIEAPDASQGISSYNAFQPDIVFMDIELPDGNGQSLLDWMIRNDPGAFVVMFSGHYDTDNLTKSISAGAKGFITKPFDANRMLHYIGVCPKLH